MTDSLPPPAAPSPPAVVATGASAGLPGGDEVFAPDNLPRLLDGECRISAVSEAAQDRLVSKRIERLHFDARTGEGTAIPVEDRGQVIRLAGLRARFDLAADYGAGGDAEAGTASRLGVAAGVEALADAGIPLVDGGSGRWLLPVEMRATTGVLFASALCGSGELVRHVRRDGDDGSGRFDRRFLDQVLATGHARFARFVGAQGPAARVDAAGAGTAVAIALAADWLRTGRCERVVVVGADDPSGDDLFEWLGAALLSNGLATTEPDVARAALPFDRRRHGAILGMGAVGIVLETEAAARRRGIRPIARLLASRLATAPGEGGQVDVAIVSREMDALVAAASEAAGVSREELARHAVFFSHDGYTGPRTGTVAAEAAALRRAFGEAAHHVVLTGTKGLTGLTFGAGIEDVAAIKAVQYRRVPPVPHLVDPDPELRGLSLSRGGEVPVTFAFRFAAGHGDEIALLAWEGVARGDERIADAQAHEAWVRAATGLASPLLVVERRALRAVDAREVGPVPGSPAPPADAPPADAPLPASVAAEAAEWERVARELALRAGAAAGDEGPGQGPETEPEAEAGPAGEFSFEESDDSPDTYESADTITPDLPERTAPASPADHELSDNIEVPERQALAGWPFSPVAVLGPDEQAAPPPTRAARVSVRADGPLPGSVRLRRPSLVPRPIAGNADLAGRVVEVKGDGALAIACRRAVVLRGGALEGPPDAVVDAGTDLATSLAAARAAYLRPPRDWVCLTRQGADAAWTSPADALVAGARVGFARALGREWSGTRVRVVDVDPAVDAQTAAVMVCEELGSADSPGEVYRDGGSRRVVELKVDAFPPPQGRLPGVPVIAITGGTRGAGARVGIELARRGPCRLALFARTPPTPEPLDEDAALLAVSARLEASGKRATVARVERRMRILRAADEARVTIDAMRAAGAEVRFYAVNLADPAAVRAGIGQVLDEMGPIDGVVHGAGADEVRPFADLDDKAFHRVFDCKAMGGLALAELLPPDAWFVSMGSLGGRFGADGQAHHSAASEAIARVCLARPRSLHLSWAHWAGVGTAAREGTDIRLEERGIEPLPPEAAAALTVDLVAAGATGEIVVAGRLGELTGAPAHPLLDGFEVEGERVEGHKRLASDDPWLGPPAADGGRALPGSAGLEMMVAAACLARPGMVFSGARDLRFRTPLKVYDVDPVDVAVRAEPLGPNEIRCSLTSERVARTGRTVRAWHFEAVVVMGDSEAEGPLGAAPVVECALDRRAVYRILRPGSAFEVLDAVSAVGREALEATARTEATVFVESGAPGMLLVEAALQGAALHRALVEGVLPEPVVVERLQFEGRGGESRPAVVTVRADGGAYHVDVDGPKGPILRVRGLWMGEVTPLPDSLRHPPPPTGWPSSAAEAPAEHRGERP